MPKSTPNGRPATAGPAADVVDLLLAQHAQIEELFVLAAGSEAEVKRDSFDQLVRLLAVHETAEEEVIHPLARKLPGAGGDAQVDDRLAEERQAKEMLTQLIDSGVDAEGFDEGLLLLRDAVLQHARHEERYEFTQLRQNVPAGRLRALAAAVRAAEAAAPTRPHPGTESATANAVLGLPLAVLDRVRDAVRRAADGKPAGKQAGKQDGKRDGKQSGSGSGGKENGKRGGKQASAQGKQTDRPKAASAGSSRKAKAAPAGDLAELTRDELYERARRAEIPGRSRMKKAELADALARTGSQGA